MGYYVQVSAGATEPGRERTASPSTDPGEQLAAVLDTLRGEIAALRIAADCLLACLREQASYGFKPPMDDADSLSSLCMRPPH